MIRAEDLHLSNLRIEREDDSRPRDETAEQLLQRAFVRLFEEQSGALHEKVEDSLLRAAYRFCHYNQVHTASLLGLSRNITRSHLIRIGELVVNKRKPAQSSQGNRLMHLSI